MTSLLSTRTAAVQRGLFLSLSILALAACGGSEEEFDSNPDIVSVSITPTSLDLERSATDSFSLEATFEDGRTEDITAGADWSSSDVTVATVDNDASKGTVTANDVNSGPTVVTAAFQGFEITANVNVNIPELDSLEISPAAGQVNVGATLQLSVEGTFSDGSKEDLTDNVTWGLSETSDSSIATVDNASDKGLVSANANDFGQVTITAVSGDITASETVDVGACGEANPAIVDYRLDPEGSLTLSIGDQQQFTAQADYCVGDLVTLDRSANTTWSSDLETTITIDADGLAEAVDVGNARITGVLGDNDATATTLITIGGFKFVQVTPGTARVAEGLTLQLGANAIRSDNSRVDVTDDATWESADSSVATVGDTAGSDKGLVTGGNIDGTTTSSVKVLITATATDENGTDVVGRRRVEVMNVTLDSLTVTTPAVGVDPDDDLPLGLTRQYQAIGTFTVQGTDPVQTFQQDLTEQVTWASDCTALSIGENTGLASGDSVSADDCPVPIIGPDNEFAVVTAEITYDGDTTTSPEVQVNVIDALLIDGSLVINTDDGTEVPNGQTMQFTARGDFTDGANRDVTAASDWSVSDETIATIATNGAVEELTAISEGNVSVIATYTAATRDSTQAPVSYDVTVTSAVIVSIAIEVPAGEPTPVSRAKGVPFNDYIATATFSDASTSDVTTSVTWVSDDTSIVVISNAAGSEGDVTTTDCDCPFDDDTTVFTAGITASSSGVTSDSVDFNVTAATLTGLVITPDDAPTTVEQGKTVSLTATASFTDGSVSNVTSETNWSSADVQTATVGNAGNTKGVVVGEAADENNVEITANYTLATDAESAIVFVRVLPPKLEAIFVDNADDSGSLTVAEGGTLNLRVTAFFEDGSEADVSADAPNTSYASNEDAIASVTSSGVVTGNSAGAVTFDISYTSAGVTERAFPQITVE